MNIKTELRNELRAAMRAETEAARAMLEAEIAGKPLPEAGKRMAEAQLARMDAEAKLEAHSEVHEELAPQVSIANYIRAAAGGEPLKGAELELELELTKDARRAVPGGTWIPFSALASPKRGQIQNADAFGSAPTADTGARITWIDRVFANTAAMFCGVRMVDVPPGVSEYVVVNQDNEDPALVSRGTQHDSHGFGMTLTSLTPTRLAAAYGFSQEDLMRVGPEMETAIRRDLTGAIGEVLDSQVLAGNGTAPNFTGLQNSGTAPTKATDADTWDEVIQKTAGEMLDGRYCSTLMQGRLLVGTHIAPYLVRLLRTGNAADQTAWEWLANRTGGIMVSAVSLAATDSNKVQDGLLVRTGGGGPNAVCATWGGGIQVIRDEQSADLVGRGRIRLTMNLYCAFAVLRTAAYERVSLRNAD